MSAEKTLPNAQTVIADTENDSRPPQRPPKHRALRTVYSVLPSRCLGVRSARQAPAEAISRAVAELVEQAGQSLA